MAMKALFLNFTMEKSPRVSSTQAPVNRSAVIFKEPDVDSQVIKVIDYNVAFGISSDKGEGHEYSPGKIKACNISFIATPILFGVLPAITKKAINRQARTYMEGYAKNKQYPLNQEVPWLIVTGTEGCAHDVFYISHNLVYIPKLPRENPIHILNKFDDGVKKVSG